MLTWGEEDYLSKIPEDKRVKILPYDERIEKIAEEISKKIHEVMPELEARHMGASSLKSSGQGDIDIYIFSKPGEFGKYKPKLMEIFGDFKNEKYDSVAWKFEKEGHEVELYLTDPTSEPMQRQIRVTQKLKENKALRNEYEKLKEGLNGKSFREYQRAKYEFYHKILDS
jgi:GrpB-like predicted nucleotidyltransferase (UPF0157 family)